MKKQYRERDIEALGQYYTTHVDAMTCENLGGKSAIAAELGYRDFLCDQAHEIKDDIQMIAQNEIARLHAEIINYKLALHNAKQILDRNNMSYPHQITELAPDLSPEVETTEFWPPSHVQMRCAGDDPSDMEITCADDPDGIEYVRKDKPTKPNSTAGENSDKWHCVKCKWHGTNDQRNFIPSASLAKMGVSGHDAVCPES